MFIIKGNTFHITRGDIASFDFSAEKEDGSLLAFSIGDIVRLKIYDRKDSGKIYLEHDVEITEETDTVVFSLSNEETTIGELSSSPKHYRYEIELNPDTFPQTLIGYDLTGEKLFVVYPEGGPFNE